MPAGLIAGAVGVGSAIGGAIGGVVNAGTNAKINAKNLELQKEQFKYQKKLNALQMQREDTAVQRSVADYQAAGLSPLNAISNPASTGSYQSAPAPQQDNTADWSIPFMQSLSALQSLVDMKTRLAESRATVQNLESSTALNNDKIGIDWANLSFDKQKEAKRAQEFLLSLNEQKRLNTSNIEFNSAQIKHIEQELKDTQWYNEHYRDDDNKLRLDSLKIANLAGIKDYSLKDVDRLISFISAIGPLEMTRLNLGNDLDPTADTIDSLVNNLANNTAGLEDLLFNYSGQSPATKINLRPNAFRSEIKQAQDEAAQKKAAAAKKKAQKEIANLEYKARKVGKDSYFYKGKEYKLRPGSGHF